MYYGDILSLLLLPSSAKVGLKSLPNIYKLYKINIFSQLCRKLMYVKFTASVTCNTLMAERWPVAPHVAVNIRAFDMLNSEA